MTKITVLTTDINVVSINNEDYICITDMLKAKDGDFFISDWLRNRNTLEYRLDKLQKSTGLDLRVFEDAITFKIALMVVRYMKYMETLEY